MPSLTEARPERTADRAVVGGRDPREQATIEAIRRMRRPHCPGPEHDRLREQVVRWNLPIAHRLAQRYRDRGESLDDLRQVAALALVKAVDRYDPERGSSFTGYATPTILGELKRHFRDRVWTVHVPRQIQEHCLDVTRARTNLAQRLQRMPSAGEIAAALAVTEEQVRATESSYSAYRADSLNRRVGPDHEACERQDLIGAPDMALETVCDRVTLEAALEELPERGRYVVRRYFFDNRTQDQIAAELRTSQMSISRVLAQTMSRLRARLSPRSEDTSPDTEDDDGRDADRAIGVRTYQARPGCLVVAIRDARRTPHAEALGEELTQLALRLRPKLFVVDLRHLRQASPRTVRALYDAYRVCGHVGGKLQVINVAPALFHRLHRAGVTRLFTCRVLGAGCVTVGASEARRSPASRAHRPQRLARVVPSGRRRRPLTGDSRTQVRPAVTSRTRQAVPETPVPVACPRAGRSSYGRATLDPAGSGRWFIRASAGRVGPAIPEAFQAPHQPWTGRPRPPPSGVAPRRRRRRRCRFSGPYRAMERRAGAYAADEGLTQPVAARSWASLPQNPCGTPPDGLMVGAM